MKTKFNKKIILSSFILLLIFSFAFISRAFISKNYHVTLDSVSLRNKVSNSNSSFAIMVENDDGEYEEYSGSSWPTDMVFNEENSVCTDKEGTILEGILTFDSDTNKATIKANEAFYCYLYFDIRKPDILVTTTVDSSESTIPTTGAYTVETTTGSYWNSKTRTLNITSVSSSKNAKYTLAFTTDSSTKTNFRDYIVGLLGGSTSVSSGDGYLVDEGDIYCGDYTSASVLEEADYGTTSQFSSSSVSSTSGTEVTVWSYADDMWTTDASSMTSGKYYHLSTTIDTSGYYQMCYSMTAGYSNNYLYVYVNGTAQTLNGSTALAPSSSATTSGCVDLGYIASGSTIKFTQRAYSSSSYSIASMSVSLELGEPILAGDAGIRYEGTDPNNYVWYNNELWQIIGVIPTLTEDGYENLVKIIRVDSIGAYAYDGKSSSTGVWGSNTLYTLLNSYYWGMKDGTGTTYCKGYQTYASHCEFTFGGIDPDGYYGSMVEYVYWNTGASTNATTPSKVYINETATQTVGGYVGIMNASDYGYAYYSTTHTTNISAYNSASITGLDWLYLTGWTWTMTASTSSTCALLVNHAGSVGDSIAAFTGYAVRPVLYLKSSDVYIAEGSGSESDPYIIGIE